MTDHTVSRLDRTVLRLTGADVRSFLQGIVTQNIDAVEDGAAVFSALLTPQGKILFDFFIVDAGDALLIDCDAGAADAFSKRLRLYKLRADVSIEKMETVGVIASATRPEGLCLAAFEDPRSPALGWRALMEDEAGGDASAYHNRRIAMGAPELGADFSAEDVFPLDVNYDLLNGVDYKKGCFVGQEVASRMKRKGEVRKRTIIAEFDGPAPQKAAPVVADGSTLGEIMSVADGKALALIRMDRWKTAADKGAPIECDGAALRLVLPEYLEQN
ncbi:MAG: folate-binding protein [Pseudomonadota bacterium]